MPLPTEPHTLVHKKDCKCPICFTRPHTTEEQGRNAVIRNLNLALIMLEVGSDELAYEVIIKTAEVLIDETLSQQEKE